MSARRHLSLAAALSLGFWPPGAQAQQAPARLANPLAERSLDELSATRERPLFSASRRQAQPPQALIAQQPDPAPAAPPAIALLGVVMQEGKAQAVVRLGATGKISRLKTGDDAGGWKVKTIEPRQLVLSLGDRTAAFDLFAAMPGPERASAVRPSAPGNPEHMVAAGRRLD
jgi:hypothetical protein